MSEMRILTVRQPWAWAIIHGGKDVENRVCNIAGSYRGPVAIHAAGEIAQEGRAAVKQLASLPWRERSVDDVRGAIIGLVELVDVHSASVIGGCGWLNHDCPEHGTCREHCSPWAQGPSRRGWFRHLVLANPRPLSAPIPYRGALGLRRLDAATIQQIEEHLA